MRCCGSEWEAKRQIPKQLGYIVRLQVSIIPRIDKRMKRISLSLITMPLMKIHSLGKDLKSYLSALRESVDRAE